ncbi:alkyl hydroperoxide reductase subunit F (plasmid) [Fulvitalea axinellae]|uniref:Alkyl hydroperoxide reductase subunit F n=1 Tax=Fulvitalea axinellae TaxID=1182444 RepID=A0AAU9CMP8_9BACT|nr:alkyl hydroperoxide reductase subunit F [Fulvitalea axinellae]
MLDQALKSQVTSLFSTLKNSYTFKVTASETHAKRDEFVQFLESVAECSERIDVEVYEGKDLAFDILKNGEETSVRFRAIPNGHEFTTLLLAVLNMEGVGKNLPDESVTRKIQSLKGEVRVRSYISLTCTNCPDVVQALNVLSIVNPNIKHEIVDGGLYQDEIEEHNVQAVPTVFVDGEQFHVGRSSMGELLQKLEDKVGKEEAVETQEPLPAKAYDVMVVGGGPAGVSASIYAARKGFSVALVAENIGGQVRETVDIENMISVSKTTGKDLSAGFAAHLNDYDIDILENRRVTEVSDGGDIKEIKTSLDETFTAPSLIITTGASWRKLGVPGESEYIGRGVAFCTHCDGPFYKGKKVAVIGGGNSGLEAAIDLANIASEVTVLEFDHQLRGDQVLQDKLASMGNVRIVTGAATTEIIGDGKKVTGLKYDDRKSGSKENVSVDGVFVQIGLTPNSGVFKEIVSTNGRGEIEIDPACRTSVPGIYAAGDVTVVPYKQIVVAMGEGSKAALSAFEDHIKRPELAAV